MVPGLHVVAGFPFENGIMSLVASPSTAGPLTAGSKQTLEILLMKDLFSQPSRPNFRILGPDANKESGRMHEIGSGLLVPTSAEFQELLM